MNDRIKLVLWFFNHRQFVAGRSLNAPPNARPMDVVRHAKEQTLMKINKNLFWTFSLCVSLLSCYLFQLSSVQLYRDGDYMQSLQLSPDADTPAIALAGTILLTYTAAIGHIIFLLAVLTIAHLMKREIEIRPADFLLNFKNERLINIVIKLIAYALTVYWLWDFIETTKVKFFGSVLFFTIVAILETWTYTLWTMNLARRHLR